MPAKQASPPAPQGDDQPAAGPVVDPQLLQQLVQQNAQMLQFMMQQNQNQAAPQQNPGVPPGAQHGQNTASMKPVPPEEFTGTCYEAWKKRIEEWVVLFSNLDAAQKAPLLKRFLKGDAAAIARAAVPVGELNEENAFDRIIEAFDRHYLTRSQIRQFLAFLALLRLENQADGNLEVYLRKWHVATTSLSSR